MRIVYLTGEANKRHTHMVIDLILDRKEGKTYTPISFYRDIRNYSNIFPDITNPILEAMDEGEEEDVKRELCKYIHENSYNPDIAKWIDTVNWL